VGTRRKCVEIGTYARTKTFPYYNHQLFYLPCSIEFSSVRLTKLSRLFSTAHVPERGIDVLVSVLSCRPGQASADLDIGVRYSELDLNGNLRTE